MHRFRTRVSLGALALVAVQACSAESANTDAGGSSGGGSGGAGGSVAGTGATSGASGDGGAAGSGAGGSGGAAGTGAIGGTAGSSGGGAAGSGATGGAAGAGAAGTGGMAGGGRGGSGGSAGTAGTSGNAGTGGSGGAPMAPTWPDCPLWPASRGNVSLSSTQSVSGNFDGQLRRYVFSGSASDAIFELANNATLRNVIIAAPGADGIHCRGNCTLQNVWWEDVGEDAATFEGSSSSTRVTIDCGGARRADDKVLQHNGGGTVVVSRFFVQEFGKLYRSCGNCSGQYARHVEIENVIAKTPGDAVIGVNENYGDTAIIRSLFIYDPSRAIHICERYTGNSTGAEPTFRGHGPDPQHCQYSVASNVFYTPQ